MIICFIFSFKLNGNHHPEMASQLLILLFCLTFSTAKSGAINEAGIALIKQWRFGITFEVGYDKCCLR
jgi:hypothetical protein